MPKWEEAPKVKQGKWANAPVVGDGADTSPIDLPKEETLFRMSPDEEPMLIEQEAPGADLARRGIDVTTGTSAGLRAVTSFAANEKYKAQYLRDVLGAQVRRGPRSGELEFLNPETNRWTLVDEAGLTPRDIADMAGPTLPVAGATAGVILGTPGGPLGEIAGAAGGAGAGDAARMAIGEWLGVNEGISQSEFIGEVMDTATVEGALQLGVSGGVRSVKAIRDIVKPRALTVEDAKTALVQMESNRELVSDINMMSAAEFAPPTGQLSGNELLLGLQNAYKGESVEAGAKIAAVERENETALEQAFDFFNPRTSEPFEAAEEVVGVARSERDAVVDAAETVAGRKSAELQFAVANVPELGEQAAGRRMREAYEAQRRVAKDAEDAAYNQYKQAYGLNEETATAAIDVPVTDKFSRFLKGFDAERLNSMFAGQQSGKSQLIPENVKESGKVNLHTLENGIKYLRRVLRKQPQATAMDASEREVVTMLDNLTLLRNEYLKDNYPELLSMAEKAEAAAAFRARTFDKSALADAFVKKGGDYVLDDTKIFAFVMKSNDDEVAGQFMRIAQQDPGAVVATKKAVWGVYKNEAVEDGIVDPKLHKSFMKRYGNVIKEVFSPSEINRINQLGDMSKVVERAAKRYDNLTRALKDEFKGKIADTSPENLISTIFGKGFSVGQTRQLVQMLEAADVDRALRDSMGTWVKNRAMLNGRVNPNNIEKLIQDKGPKLKAVFGPEYVENLQKISDAANIIRSTAKGLTPRKTNPFTDLMRVAFAPPLTRRGRAQTLLVNIRYDAAQRAVGDALTHPEALEALVRLERDYNQAQRAARVLTALGGYAFLTEED